MLIPMSLARPERAWLYAFVCTATSVLAASSATRSARCSTIRSGIGLIEFYGLGGKVEAFRASYSNGAP